MTTTTNTADTTISIQYKVEAPTPDQIIALEALTPKLGPTATIFIIRAAVRCAGGTFYEQFDPDELAGTLGLGSLKSTLYKTIRRLELFRIVHRDSTGCLIIDRWPDAR